VSIAPFNLNFRYLVLAGDAAHTDVGVNYPIWLTAGFQY